MRFTGKDSEIDVEHPDGAHEAEFAAWRWEALAEIPRLIVPFKRSVYERVAAEFAKYATKA
jgi:putative (di)nucleoside polyphosphate hydrolase